MQKTILVTGATDGIGLETDILCRAVLSDEFAAASGRYFENDSGRFASPHPDALNPLGKYLKMF